MPEELISFWKQADLSNAPFVHPSDEDAIPDGWKHFPEIRSYEDYVRALREDKLKRHKLHLTLLPQPYHGDIANARVVLLLLNPGVEPSDFYLEDNVPEYRKELVATIRQTRKANVFLDPRWAWTSGFSWWEKKLRRIAEEIVHKKLAGSYGAALEMLSKELACLELVPYHSTAFGTKTNIPSATVAKQAARRIAEDGSRTVIVARRVKEWDLPDQDNVIKYSPRQARGANLGPETPGGKAILEHVGLDWIRASHDARSVIPCL